jgi:hypothetical protein
MALLTGMTEAGQEVPVQVKSDGRLVAEGLTGPAGPAGPNQVAAGTSASPSISFAGDPNTGIYSPGADQVAISTNGTGRLFIDSSGRLGLGTSSPSGLFTFAWNSSTGINSGLIGQVNNAAGANNGYRIGLRTSTSTDNWCSIDQAFTNLGVNADTYIAFTTTNTSNSAAERMRLTSTGLGIGTTSPGTILNLYGSNVPGVGQLKIDSPSGEYSQLTLHQGATSLAFFRSNSSAFDVGSAANIPFTLHTNGSERARIDSSGRLLVGTVNAPAGAPAGSVTAKGGVYLQSPNGTWFAVGVSDAGQLSVTQVALTKHDVSGQDSDKTR